jgi:hypothetical protein
MPIHAAGNYRHSSPECAADYVSSSYVPTLSACTKARSGWKPIPRTHLAGLVVCDEASNIDGARFLPSAAEEVRIVRACFDLAHARVLNSPSARTSLSDMRSLLEYTPAHILHFACHAVHASDPLRSALVLQDGNLTIQDIMDLHLPNAVLAVLSACQTAKGDRNAPDQAVHLAASMLFCGLKNVIGTMWWVVVNAHGAICLLMKSTPGSCTTRTAQKWRVRSTKLCSEVRFSIWTTCPTRSTRRSKCCARRVCLRNAGHSSCTWVAEAVRREGISGMMFVVSPPTRTFGRCAYVLYFARTRFVLHSMHVLDESGGRVDQIPQVATRSVRTWLTAATVTTAAAR